MNRVAVVILNYRTPDLALAALESVAAQASPDDALLVVDNEGGDDALERLRAGVAARGLGDVGIVSSPVNGGFSAGNNLGIRAVTARAYLLLNSDATLRPGALDRLWEALEADPGVGLVSPRLLAPDGTPQSNCFRRHTPVSELLAASKTGPVERLLARWRVALPPDDPAAGVDPEWTSFAAVLIRREVIEQVGLLDEGFFMYFEDVDYCLRARAAGWRIGHEPRAEVVHLHAASSKLEALSAARRRRPAYFYAARRRYYGKTLGRLGPLAANALWTVGRGIAWTREALGNKAPHAVERELRDVWLG
ncbi:MAG: glycosyltransferase family 2 protein [Planctomycetota bacterium]|nr:glycosyltransferase family 2 protein [Planctomycetota bacterium]